MKRSWLRFSTLVVALATPVVSSCAGEAVIRSTSAAGLLELSANALDFGMTACGDDEPEPQVLTLTNNGDSLLRWTAALDSTAHFAIAGIESGTIEPGGQATIAITARKVPAATAAGTVIESTLRVVTNDTLQTELQVPVTATAYGATLELAAPSLADFGEAPLGVEAPAIGVLLRNVGNAPATVSIAEPPDDQFSFTWEGDEPVEVAPGEAVPELEARFTAAKTAASSSVGFVSVDGPVCGASTSQIAVTGKGMGGIVGVSPGAIDFGKVDCNSQAAPYTVTIYNTGNALFAWSAELNEGANHTLSQNGGAVPPGEVAEVRVIPKPIGMTDNLADNGFGDTLTITTSVEGDEPHELPIKETARGAILKYSTAEIDFGAQTLFLASDGKALTISNDGNAAVDVELDGGEFIVDPPSGTISAGGKLDTSLSFKPAAFGLRSGAVGVSVKGALCQPLPEPVATSGDGNKTSAIAISVGGHGRRNRGGSHNSQGGCAILASSSGSVACWGTNEYGQLGVYEATTGPRVIPELSGIVSVSSGGDFNCAVDQAGDVWCWGNNRNRDNAIVGKLGVTGVSTSATPVKVEGVSDATQVSCGHNIACARKKDGTVWCWGTDKRGNLGTGGNNQHNNPASQVPGMTEVVAITAGAGGACALRSDQRAWCWGRYRKGTLGNGSSSDGTAAPTQVSLSNIATITTETCAARHGPRCALTTTGTGYCWGSGTLGQLGNGATSKSSFYYSPTAVSSLAGATAIEGFYNGACALMGDKTIRCWGSNRDGQIGDGTTTMRSTPVTVSGINDATAIAAGGKGVCAIVTNGSVKCWGNYGAGNSTLPQPLRYF